MPFLLFACAGDAPEPAATAGVSEPHEAASQELDAALARLHDTWNPDRRAEVFADFGRDRDRLTPALLAVLGQAVHPDLEQAIALAEACEVHDARAALFALGTQGPLAHRAPALRAAAVLEPFSTLEVGELLATEHVPTLVVVMQSGGDLPGDRLVDFLEHVDPQVRAAAAAAISARPQRTAEVDRIAASVAAGYGYTETTVRALGRPDLAPDAERTLLDLLANAPDDQRRAALDALAHKRSPLRDAKPVWDLADDPSVPVGIRASALSCLERTRSFHSDEIEERLDRLPSVLRYHAARCLLLEGKKSGIETMVELLGAEESSGDDSRRTLSHDVRRVLGQVSGLGSTASADELRTWSEGLTTAPRLTALAD